MSTAPLSAAHSGPQPLLQTGSLGAVPGGRHRACIRLSRLAAGMLAAGLLYVGIGPSQAQLASLQVPTDRQLIHRDADDRTLPTPRSAMAEAIRAAQQAGQEPDELADQLIPLAYPLIWIVEDIVFYYGEEQLPALVQRIALRFGQSAKDLLRDAIRAGAMRRAAVIDCLAARAAANPGADAAEIAGPCNADPAWLAWEPVNWDLVAEGERLADLRFLQPNDDPGGLASRQ